jgi:hypothetical protein
MTAEPIEPDFAAPVVIVGPGRSGTTLLGSALGEHPDFYMIGETQFLMQRMWKVLIEFPTFVNYMRFSKLAQQTRPEWSGLPWYSFAMDIAGPDPEGTLGHLYTNIEKAESARIARELGASFARMLIPPPLRRRYWGMQEIWLGSASFPYSLELYETAFPNARYLHSVRNPLAYLSSNFNNRKVLATRETTIYELNEWIRMTRYARTLADTRRYLEFRHEDFVGDGGRTAESVFAFAGLDMPQQCRRILEIRHLPSSGPNVFMDRADEFFSAVPGLRDEMERHGYLD